VIAAGLAATLASLTLLAVPTGGEFTVRASTGDGAAVRAAAPDGLTTVRLRAAVRTKDAETVRLRDIAEVDGPLADALGALVVADRLAELPSGASGWRTIDLYRVRSLIEADGTVNLGRVILQGSGTSVRAHVVRAQGAEVGVVAQEEAPRVPRGGTVEAHLHATIRGMLGLHGDTVRVRFDEKDGALLATTTAGRTVEVRPVGLAEKLPLAVTVYERDRTVVSETITAVVHVRRDVRVSVGSIARGDPLTTENTVLERRWLAPDERPASPEVVLGSLAHSQLVPGRPISVVDIEAPLAAERNDRVMVHALGRGVVVRMPGRVKADVRTGETVQIELVASGETVTARMDGPGRAVLVVEQARGVGPSAADPESAERR
jgi:flagella basal body P-ring formation protein FlgA